MGDMKALLLENIHPVAVEVLEDRGFEVELRPGSLSEAELAQSLDGVGLLGIRSNTHITEKVLDAAPDLLAVGCFCIGTNQVALDAAAERGIAVFNAPYSNTRSVVELVIGEIIALARRLPEKTLRMHDGVWDKSARGSHEVRGRTLGIVGYGNIGTQLSNVAEAMGMRVVFYDTADRPAHGNARRMRSMDDLLAISDVVSLHVDGRPGQRRLLRARAVRDDEAARPCSSTPRAAWSSTTSPCATTCCPATSPAPPSTCSRSSRRRRATRSSRCSAASTTSS